MVAPTQPPRRAQPAGDGSGSDFARVVGGRQAWLAATAAGVIAVIWGDGRWLWAFGGTVLLVVAGRAYFRARLGGVTGDCLGATAVIAEAVTLAVFAWKP